MKRAPVRPIRVAGLGCRRDVRDQRDHLFTPPPQALPPSVDLREHCPPVMDQGDEGSCVAHGTTAALRFCLIKAGKPDVALARNQLYWDGRSIEGTTKSDAGLEIRDAIKTAAKLGVAHENLWPYGQKTLFKRPPASVYKDALQFQALTYQRVQVNTFQLKAALVTGFPVVIGVTLYDSFESDEVARTGVVPMPGPKEGVLGGHCMAVCGYGQKPGTFTVRNSWGSSWGNGGDCFMPEAYLGDPRIGSDYWLVQTVG